MSEYKRLTARSPKNNLAYLVNVKPSEQVVESKYPNTLRRIQESFEQLAQYEEIGSPEEFAKLAKTKEYGNREFCKDACVIQKAIDISDSSPDVIKQIRENHCTNSCWAYKFHVWLDKNGYRIVKQIGGNNT